MNCQSRLGLSVIALAASSIEGFTLAPNTVAKSGSCCSRLHLVPEQGQQLVAAFEAGSAHWHEEENGDHHPALAEEKPIGLIAKNAIAAKAVMSRIFSIPGAIMGRHAAAEPALVDIATVESDTDDVVLYPLVGFKFVGGEVLATTANASCRISDAADEEVFGWYTTACRLDSIYSDTYCDEPQIMVTDVE